MESWKYNWLYSNTDYARLRRGRHIDGAGSPIREGYWYRTWKSILNLYKSTNSSGRIIDIGSGPNNLKLFAGDMAHLITTVDFAEAARPDLIADICSIPVADEFADVSVCMDVLEHIEENRIDAAISEIRRVTKLAAYVSISYRRERRRFNAVGDLHITVKSPEWWGDKIKRRFTVLGESDLDRGIWKLHPLNG